MPPRAAAAHQPLPAIANDPFIFQILDDLDDDQSGQLGLRAAVDTFLTGGDLGIKPEISEALERSINAQRGAVCFDDTTLDMMAVSLRSLDAEHAAELQAHPKIGTLCAMLNGLAGQRHTTALAGARVYAEILRAFGANSSAVLNSFCLRATMSRISKLLLTYGKEREGGEADGEAALTQETQGNGTQQSISLTQTQVPTSQMSQVPASQRPKRRRVGGKRAVAAALPEDWEEVYTAAEEFVGVFADGVLLRSLRDHSLAHALLESVAALPPAELQGTLAAAGVLAPQPTKLTRTCHTALRCVMEHNAEYEVVHEGAHPDPPDQPRDGEEGAGDQQGAQDGDDRMDVDGAAAGGGDDGAAERANVRTTTAQELVLPLLLPVLHLTPVYLNSQVALKDAVRLQEATVELICQSGITQPTLRLLMRHFVLACERRPRTEPMEHACGAGAAIAALLDPEGREGLLAYLRDVLCSEKIFQRLFALELSFRLFKDPRFELSAAAGEELLGSLVEAVNDAASCVRAKALSDLAALMIDIGNQGNPVRPICHSFFQNAARTALPPEMAPPQVAPETHGTPGAKSADNSCVSYSPGGPAVVATRRHYITASVIARAREEKALVRKAALDLLLQFFEHSLVDVAPAVSVVLDLMDQRIENSVFVRRQAVFCAWAIANRFTDLRLRHKMIAEGILTNYPLENEEFVQNTMVRALFDVVFLPLEKKQGDRAYLTEEEVWQLLGTLNDTQLRVLGRVCCRLLDPENPTQLPGRAMGAGILKTLLGRIDRAPAASREAWAILPVVARDKSLRDKVDVSVIMKSFTVLQPELHSTNLDSHSVLQNVLAMLAELRLSEQQQHEVAKVLEERLLSLKPHPNLVDACVRCYAALARPSTVRRLSMMFNELCTTMFYNLLARNGGKPLPQSVADAGLESVGLDELPVAVCTLGALVLTESGRPATESALERLCHMVNSVCNAAPVASAANEPLPPFDPNIPRLVLKHAFLCEARLCALSKPACKKGVPLLLRGLSSNDTAVKTVCLNGLADLSVRHPGTVDKYLPNMAVCMSDMDPRVRLTALTLVTQLLAESFIKPRPFLVYELLAAIADREEAVAAFARYALLKVLLPKDPLVLANSFTEALFVFNNYSHHPRFNKHPTKIYKLCGDDLRDTRIELLRFVASKLNGQKEFLRVFCQLHELILDTCTEEGRDGVRLRLDTAEGRSLLKDTLKLLDTPQLRLSRPASSIPKADSGTKQGGGVVDEEEEEERAAMVEKQWKLAVRTILRDNICPILCSVFQYLREQKSPLQQDIIAYAARVTQDHEKELDEMIMDEVLRRDVSEAIERNRRARGFFGRRAAPPAPGATPQCPLRAREPGGSGGPQGEGHTPQRRGSVPRHTPGTEQRGTPGAVAVPLLRTPGSRANALREPDGIKPMSPPAPRRSAARSEKENTQ
eukprot:TRINITY_DN14752_c0_g3_i1.p1 TRINITY_DN14752_c0_g3~~TRINITY_DN14752_c0_g3_i1.p1  ORF type:complete len:1474 (+),score=591.46 TRINITY_DN14752_c0_g3_i1:115-4422(+)